MREKVRTLVRLEKFRSDRDPLSSRLDACVRISSQIAIPVRRGSEADRDDETVVCVVVIDDLEHHIPRFPGLATPVLEEKKMAPQQEPRCHRYNRIGERKSRRRIPVGGAAGSVTRMSSTMHRRGARVDTPTHVLRVARHNHA